MPKKKNATPSDIAAKAPPVYAIHVEIGLNQRPNYHIGTYAGIRTALVILDCFDDIPSLADIVTDLISYSQ